jgi:hypothetical protein
MCRLQFDVMHLGSEFDQSSGGAEDKQEKYTRGEAIEIVRVSRVRVGRVILRQVISFVDWYHARVWIRGVQLKIIDENWFDSRKFLGGFKILHS